MTQTYQGQSTLPEDQVRAAIAAALQGQGARIETNAPGTVVADLGSVGKAFLAGAFRAGSKMPVRIRVATAGGPTGTGISVEVAGRGGSGFMSGGLIGMNKLKKAEKAWLQDIVAAIPGLVGAPPNPAP